MKAVVATLCIVFVIGCGAASDSTISATPAPQDTSPVEAEPTASAPAGGFVQPVGEAQSIGITPGP